MWSVTDHLNPYVALFCVFPHPEPFLSARLTTSNFVYPNSVVGAIRSQTITTHHARERTLDALNQAMTECGYFPLPASATSTPKTASRRVARKKAHKRQNCMPFIPSTVNDVARAAPHPEP
jgi:hypothetical protein